VALSRRRTEECSETAEGVARESERGYGKPAMQVAAQSENDGSEQKEFRTVEEIRLFLLERGIDVARVPAICCDRRQDVLMLELEPEFLCFGLGVA
jgi:hypothetical protein